MAGPRLSDDAVYAVPSYLHTFRPASLMSSNKIDEGYSEETKSQSGSDTMMRCDTGLAESMMMDPDSQYPLPDSVLSMSEEERSEFAYAILRSLRTSSIADIVEKLNPLLHLDPVLHLPAEITFDIFSYLDPVTLLRCSTLSKAWRTRVMDSPLWRLLFRLEGWNSNFGHVRVFEEAEKARRAAIKERRTRARTTDNLESDIPFSKRQARDRTLFGDGKPPRMNLDGNNEGYPRWGEQYGAVEADDSSNSKGDDQMEGISYDLSSATTPISERPRREINPTENYDILCTPMPNLDNLHPPIAPSLLLPSTKEPKVNWQYLYKQKRRLEENWDFGRFSNFQLPHPDHPEERHTECVYTIQYSGKYLVSGSRDHSVRIWNLDTQRLIHPPLLEHEKSVLCLQFDERPEQDILISAGSDCCVILWKFSTGKMIRKIENAHTESVLNLRFDDRYLVTCSKDKTIKVWNRKEMMPTDDAYPRSTASKAEFPSYIIDMQQQEESSCLHFNPLPSYSLLMTMHGHGAAVNAIQIYDGQIVSASGDRQVKVWDVRTGACLKTFTGHTKGIACVQFDGRRIVSGSSDETVRIFDRKTGAEVACLQGHTNLVRTVQAQFGDLPGNDEELAAEAKAVDRNFFEAQRKGLVPTELTREQRHARNAGSRDPKAIFAYGAKLPPGGGGSKWARIVSGSYDETIIIWKKGADGAWEKSKVLHQNEAARAAAGGRRRPIARSNRIPQPPGHQSNIHALAQQAQAQAQVAQTIAQQAHALHAAQAALAAHHGAATTGINIGAPAPNANPAAHQANQPGPVQQGPTNGIPHHHHHGPHHHHHPNPHALINPAANHAGTSSSRVFKLQFDARRIICCSQDPTIVGWDFANNDKDIILASQFFGESA